MHANRKWIGLLLIPIALVFVFRFSDIVNDLTPQLGGDLDPNGFGITGEVIAPTQALEGFAGFARGQAQWYADLSDTDAYVTAGFDIKVGGSFKVRLTFAVTYNVPVSGHLHVGHNHDEDAAESLVNLLNADWDLVPGAANRVQIWESAATAATGNDCHVFFRWAKDAAGTGLKYIYIYGVALIRQ